MTKKIFCEFEPTKMHWAFFRVTNAFQYESWDLSNSKGYEFDRKYIDKISTQKSKLAKVSDWSLHQAHRGEVLFFSEEISHTAVWKEEANNLECKLKIMKMNETVKGI